MGSDENDPGFAEKIDQSKEKDKKEEEELEKYLE